MDVGKKLYYDNITGEIILELGEKTGGVIESIFQDDLKTYFELQHRLLSTIGCLQLEYGQYKEEFSKGLKYKVNIQTKDLSSIILMILFLNNSSNPKNKKLNKNVLKLLKMDLIVQLKIMN